MLVLAASLAVSVTALNGQTSTVYAPVPQQAFTRFTAAPIMATIDPTRQPSSPSPSPSADPSPRPTPQPVRPAVIVKVRLALPAAGHHIKGRASTYCCTARYGNGLYAAPGPALRIAMGGSAGADLRAWWRGRAVRVCSRFGCVTVRLVDWCRCTGSGSDKLIDLEPAAMARVLPDYESAGVVTVTVSW